MENIKKLLKAKSFITLEAENFHMPEVHLHKPAIFLDDALEIFGQVDLLVSGKFTENEKDLIKSIIISQIAYLEFEIQNNPNLGDLEVKNTITDITNLRNIASKFSR